MRECGMDGCHDKHLAKGMCNKHYRASRRVPSSNPTGRPRSWTQKDLDRAKMLLEDGVSYREAARSTPVPRTTMREKIPNMGWTLAEGGQFIQSLTRPSPQMRTMYEQIGHFQ